MYVFVFLCGVHLGYRYFFSRVLGVQKNGIIDNHLLVYRSDYLCHSTLTKLNIFDIILSQDRKGENMRKRLFITISVLAVVIGLMVWDDYENNELKKQETIAKAEFEKIYTVADIFEDANLKEKPTSLNIRIIESEPLNPDRVNVTDEKQQKQIMDAINKLQVQKTLGATPYEDIDYAINIESTKGYGLHVSEKKKQIAFLDLDNDSTKTEDKLLYEYTILKGDDEFFDALKDIQ